jgi:small basic protein (TIGR04137 family)
MSIHSSLRTDKHKKQKSVLKRLERLMQLKKESKWNEEESVFGLAKVKIVRMKLKKEKKAATPEEAAAAEAAAAGAAPAATPAATGAKAAAGTKATPGATGQKPAAQPAQAAAPKEEKKKK